MGKYSKQKTKGKSSHNNGIMLAIAVVVGLLAILMVVAVVMSRSGLLNNEQGSTTTPPTGGGSNHEVIIDPPKNTDPVHGEQQPQPGTTTDPSNPGGGQTTVDPANPGGEQKPTDPPETKPMTGLTFDFEAGEVLPLDMGIMVTSIDKYTGIYMEDGTNEIVSNIMMVTVKNTTEQDLQIIRFSLVFMNYTAEFEASNIPAGASVILLEKNRHAYIREGIRTVSVSVVNFFEEPMRQQEDVLKIAGADGTLNIQNISDQDITGDIFIYYKNWAAGTYYGGITFRIKVEGGVKAGGIVQIPTGHFNSDNCQVVDVVIGT